MRANGQFDGERNARKRGVVEHAVHSFERSLKDLNVADVGVNELGIGIEVFTPTGAEIIDHPNPLPVRDESVGYVRADEPRPASDGDRPAAAEPCARSRTAQFY